MNKQNSFSYAEKNMEYEEIIYDAVQFLRKAPAAGACALVPAFAP